MEIDDLFEKHSVAYYDANEAKTEVLTKRRFTAAVSELEQQLFIEQRQNEMLIKECEDLKKQSESDWFQIGERDKKIDSLKETVKRLQENIIAYMNDRDCAVQAYNDTKAALEKSEAIRAEYLDEIDKLRLGVCQVKEMLVPGKFDIMEANKIFTRIL